MFFYMALLKNEDVVATAMRDADSPRDALPKLVISAYSKLPGADRIALFRATHRPSELTVKDRRLLMPYRWTIIGQGETHQFVC